MSSSRYIHAIVRIHGPSIWYVSAGLYLRTQIGLNRDTYNGISNVISNSNQRLSSYLVLWYYWFRHSKRTISRTFKEPSHFWKPLHWTIKPAPIPLWFIWRNYYHERPPPSHLKMFDIQRCRMPYASARACKSWNCIACQQLARVLCSPCARRYCLLVESKHGAVNCIIALVTSSKKHQSVEAGAHQQRCCRSQRSMRHKLKPLLILKCLFISKQK
jgi:hypothetical protein